MKYIAVIAALSLFAQLSAHTEEWYVSVDGHDDNSGDANAPLRTLFQAADQAKPGDRIIVQEGVVDEGEWTSLFDGKTLDGWHIKALEADRDKPFWSVSDGAIFCDSMEDADHNYVWLMTDHEYADFELRLKIRSYGESSGNSGVQVRSRYDDEAGWLDGPQVDIHPPDGWRSGLIYDETRGTRRWIEPSLSGSGIEPSQGPQNWEWIRDGWNDVYIRCQGTRIQTVINGYVIADYDGAGLLDDAEHRTYNVGLKGHIALQLHIGCQLRMAFKDIYIREIPTE